MLVRYPAELQRLGDDTLEADGRAFFGCFNPRRNQLGRMSLNRCEQRVYDYLQARPEEGQHWRQKVRARFAETGDRYAAAARLEAELWRYYEERSGVAEPFRSAALREGLRRTSMRNLADLLLHLWTEPRPRRPAADGAAG
jgi:predicted amidohydrolase